MKQFFILLTIVVCIFTSPSFANAAESLTVSPSLVQIDLASDKPEATLTYTNDTDQTIDLAFQAQNFTELEDGYKLSYLQGQDAENYRYGLSRWIRFDKTTLILSPHAKGTITVTIYAQELSPGAHYGTVLAQTSTNPENGTIGIHGTIASLIFVRTNTGKEIEKANVQVYELIKSFPWQFPNQAFIRLQNTGDTDITPHGVLFISDQFGRTVGKGIVNEDSLNTLPESIRRYNISIAAITWMLPGIYHATMTLHYGKTNTTIQETKTFFSEGTFPFAEICVVIFLIGLLFYSQRAHLQQSQRLHRLRKYFLHIVHVKS